MKRTRQSERATTACIPCRAAKLRCDGSQPVCARCQSKPRPHSACTWPDADGRSIRARIAPSSSSTLADLATAACDDTSASSARATSPSFHPAPPLTAAAPLATIDSVTFADIDWSLVAGLDNDTVPWWDPNETIRTATSAFSAAITGHAQQPLREVPDRLRVSYYRRMGPTGISPGYKKITMEIALSEQAKQALQDAATRGSGEDSALTPCAQPPAVENGPEEDDDLDPDAPVIFDGDLPAQWVLDDLIPLFFTRLGDHFACLDSATLNHLLAANEAPPMLINAMCALAARYSTHPSLCNAHAKSSAGEPFADKAKTFLAASLTFPSKSTTLAYLMLAWCEFAVNLDSAFWNYAGLAMRMSIDLGLHNNRRGVDGHGDSSESAVGHAADELIDAKLLFWSVYQMDRILGMGTGRPTSINDGEISVDAPSSRDVVLKVQVHLLQAGSKIVQALNSATHSSDQGNSLDFLQEDLLRIYDDLPPSLRLSLDNFAACPHKHVFLELHLWMQCLLLTLNRPAIARLRGVDTNEQRQLVKSAIRKCQQVVSLDEAHAREYLICAPMTNTALFLAGSAELEELHAQQSSTAVSPSVSRFLASEAYSSFTSFSSALDHMAQYWDGVRWISGVLKQREAGRTDEDLTELSQGTDAVLSRHEMRLLQRLHAGRP